MPHRRPEDRLYTVISGVFRIGLGEQFDAEKLEAYPPGSVIVLPGNTFHFHWAKSSDYVTQVTAMGPLGLEDLSADDNPRNHNSFFKWCIEAALGSVRYESEPSRGLSLRIATRP